MQRAAMRVAGIVLLAVGVVAAVALWLLAGRRYDDALGELAPAPIGCTTTLRFDRPGTYTFFVETKGEVGELDGNCETDGRAYELDDELPSLELTLLDSGGRDVDLDRADGPSYDRAGRRGEAVQVVEITDAGEYRLTATFDDADGANASDVVDAMIRVGRDPARGVAAIRAGAVVAMLAGLIAGVGLLVAGRRRTVPARDAATVPPWPSGPLGPAPLAPPSADRPTTPVYAPRPPSHGPPPASGAPAGAPRRPDGPPTSSGERPPGGWPGRGGSLPPPRPPD